MSFDHKTFTSLGVAGMLCCSILAGVAEAQSSGPNNLHLPGMRDRPRIIPLPGCSLSCRPSPGQPTRRATWQRSWVKKADLSTHWII